MKSVTFVGGGSNKRGWRAMDDVRKPKLSELRPGDTITVTNKDNDVSSDFYVEEVKLLWLFPIKRLVEAKLYVSDSYPLSYLNRKEIHWKLKAK